MNEFLTGAICVEENWIPFFFSPTYEYFCVFAANTNSYYVDFFNVNPVAFRYHRHWTITLDNIDWSITIITNVCVCERLEENWNL